MHKVNLNEVMIGSILAEPVYINEVLLCKEDTPISASLLNALKRFQIEEVSIQDIITPEIDTSKLSFGKLNQLTYLTVKQLSIDETILCAKALVTNMMTEKYDALLNVLFYEDDITYSHSLNVACLAVSAAIKIGFNITELYNIALGSLLHDIGKSSVDKVILHKPGELTEEEYEIIKQHPEIGYSMIKDADIDTAVKQIVYQHHENWDGSGYPRKLYGTNSYRVARLVHIVDVYEALCVKRSYKDAIPRRTVRKIMLENSNKMFDPVLLKQFLRFTPLYTVGEEIFYKGAMGIICGTSDPEEPLVFTSGKVLKLSEFELLSEEKEQQLRKEILRL